MTVIAKNFLDKLDDVHQRATKVFDNIQQELLNNDVKINKENKVSNLNANDAGIKSIQKVKPK